MVQSQMRYGVCVRDSAYCHWLLPTLRLPYRIVYSVPDGQHHTLTAVRCLPTAKSCDIGMSAVDLQDAQEGASRFSVSNRLSVPPLYTL